MRRKCLISVWAIMAVLSMGVTIGFLLAHQPSAVLIANPKAIRLVVRDRANEHERNTVVELQNLGQRHIHISSVHATCGCTVAKLRVNELRPGGTTTLEISISPLPVGKKTSVVTVEYVAESRKTLRIPIDISVDEPPVSRFLTAPTELSLNSAARHGVAFQIEVKEPAVSIPLLTSIHCSDSRLDAHLTKPPEARTWSDAFVIRTYEVTVSTKFALEPDVEFGAYLTFEFSKSVLEVRDVPVLVKHQPIARAIPPSVECELHSEATFPITRKVYLVARSPGDRWRFDSDSSLPGWLHVKLGRSSAETTLTPLTFEVMGAVRDALEKSDDDEYLAQVKLVFESDGSVVTIPLKFRQ